MHVLYIIFISYPNLKCFILPFLETESSLRSSNYKPWHLSGTPAGQSGLHQPAVHPSVGRTVLGRRPLERPGKRRPAACKCRRQPDFNSPSARAPWVSFISHLVIVVHGWHSVSISWMIKDMHHIRNMCAPIL